MSPPTAFIDSSSQPQSQSNDGIEFGSTGEFNLEEGNNENMDLSTNALEVVDPNAYFIELMNCEEETEKYLQQLIKEELELRAELDEHIKDSQNLRELQSTSTAKISAQQEKVEELKAKQIQILNQQLKAYLQETKEEVERVNISALTLGTSELHSHTFDSGAVDKRLRLYRSRQAVSNASRTKKVQAMQIDQKMQKDISEIHKINKQIQGIEEQRKAARMLQKIGQYSKMLVTAEEGKRSKLENTVKMLEAQQKHRHALSFLPRLRLPPLPRSPFNRFKIN